MNEKIILNERKSRIAILIILIMLFNLMVPFSTVKAGTPGKITITFIDKNTNSTIKIITYDIPYDDGNFANNSCWIHFNTPDGYELYPTDPFSVTGSDLNQETIFGTHYTNYRSYKC